MRPFTLLYWRLHRLARAGAVAIACLVVVAGIGHWGIALPWINQDGLVNVTVLAELAYGCVVPLAFRNQASFLEEVGDRRWRIPDGAVIVVLWGLPLLVPVTSSEGWRFFYACSIILVLWVFLGRFLRTDTIMVVLAGIFLVQTTVWSALQFSPWRVLLFLLETPPAPMSIAVAGACGACCILGVGRFKRAGSLVDD